MTGISARPLDGLPEIHPGEDLAALIAHPPPTAAAVTAAAAAAAATTPTDPGLHDGDVVVIAHKAVSKAEGRTRTLSDVHPGPVAERLAAEHDKDPRLVQVVLDESRRLIRAVRGVLIVETHHGFICANAGVDASNVPGDEAVVLLPVDPDASARALRARLTELTGARLGVVVTDSFGRAWRVGQCDVAIGVAGLNPIEDWRGRDDYAGREMHATVIAVADQLAAVADLARAKDAMQPVVVVSGAERHLLAAGEDGPGAAALVRDAASDLFR